MTAAALLALVAVAAVSAPVAAPPPDRFPRAAAAYVVAIDGEVRWAREPDTPLPPASLTKILTAVELLGGDWDADAIVTVSPRAAGLEGTRMRLRAGERLHAGDLLTGLVVASANDACIALAEHAAGSVEAFMERLAARARALGLAGTRYANPCGLPAEDHATTARDLLRMADVAMALPDYARRAALESASVGTLEGRRITLRTTNMLLGRTPGVTGVKTGYTRQAGKCLVASAERDGHRVTVVLLHAPDRWWTAAALIEEAFHVAGRPR